MRNVIGTCGNCGGAVGFPDVWHGVQPPTPSCFNCHAQAKNPYGPIIAMAPSPFSFGFGKHRGKNVEYVVREDPTYILWCHDNVDQRRIPFITEEVLAKARDAVNESMLDAAFDHGYFDKL